MIFSSYKFIFAFFPVVYIVYNLMRKAEKPALMKCWLVLASLFFYGYGDFRFFPILVFTAIFNFIISVLLQRTEKKAIKVSVLALGLVENLGLLFYFKYHNFFFENLNALTGAEFTLRNIILPLGISFYTFQLISYIVDSYKGEAKGYNFIDYMVFVTFFPQLIVGPVVSHEDIMPQLKKKNLLNIEAKNIMLGILLFAIGCFKKTVIADPLITHASAFYNASEVSGMVNAWSAVIAYTFAYYFDFSGYIDMALGLGRMFNIELPQNFNSPYKARTFADFWRRWNMTISRFFNNTVFANLFHFGDRIPKLIFATLATFFVSGIWHGAGWNFILWGLVNGVFVCIANIMMLYRLRLPAVISYPATFIGCVFVRVLFDSPTLAVSGAVFKEMFDFGAGFKQIFLTDLPSLISGNAEVCVIMLIGALICFLTPNSTALAEKRELSFRHAVYSAALIIASLACMGRVSTFLYFNFCFRRKVVSYEIY